MSIKLIVTDLDGTLLRDDKTISERTRSVLMRCRERGIKVIYATGRGGSATRLAPSAYFDGRIAMNGAIAFKDDTVVYNRLIPFQTARPLLLACDRHGLRTASEISDMHYANFNVSDIWSDHTQFNIVDFAQHDIDAEKLYAIICSAADVAFIKKHLPEDLYLSVSRDGLAQMMHRDATKSKAVAELARVWNIDQSEIAAFGDDLNDIDLLNFAGVGVAMGNAIAEVKVIADQMCRSNEEDGLAEWIAENLLR